MCYCYWLNEQMNIEGRPEKTGHMSGVLPNSQLSTKILTKPGSALGAIGGGMPCSLEENQSLPEPFAWSEGAFQTLRTKG